MNTKTKPGDYVTFLGIKDQGYPDMTIGRDYRVEWIGMADKMYYQIITDLSQPAFFYAANFKTIPTIKVSDDKFWEVE